MKVNLRILFLVVFSTIVIAIDAAKPNVYVAEFKNECHTKDSYVAQLRNAVIQSLTGTHRVNIFTPDADMLQAMEERRRNSGNLAVDDIEMMRELERKGANSIVTGSLDGVSISSKTNDKGEKTYTAIISITIRAIDPQTGQVIESVSFKYGDPILGLLGATGKTEDAAVQKAMEDVSAWGIIQAVAPLHGNILELEKVNDKKKKVEMLYIDLGSEAGVGRGHTFAVMLNRKIGGMDSKKQIGTLEIVEVQGPKVSLCKVKKGKEEIFNAIDKDQDISVDSY